ncbi:unnamed protein product [Ascophyllum nodosum]
MWLSVMTRPDIANELRACAYHSHDPSPRHWKALLQVAAYVNATKEIDLRLVRCSGLRLSVYAGADYATASNDRRSVSLMWLSVMTRPDIANELRACARHSHNPSPRHWKALLQVAAYVNTTKEIGLKFVRGFGLKLSAYADADYAAASNDRRSVSGVAVVLGDTAIDWKSSAQKCVTTTTCEAEYVALCVASKEALFTRAVLVFLQPELSDMRVDIFGDNEAAKAIAY